MSQHPSLKSGTKDKAHRSVWKRFERLRFLVDKGKWQEGESIFGLPKMKLIKVKIKKEKAEVAEGEAGAVAPEAGSAASQEGKTPKEGKATKEAASPAKEAPDAKGAKKQEKK
ncbi:MAG: small basic protein [Candidatus Omnitrophica bacterium]|nr:small basic protein [Candidatus Omnitrophota bacterium]